MTHEAVVNILREFKSLVDDYNTALDSALRAIKSELQRTSEDRLVISGIGAQKRTKRWYDGEKLAQLLPSRIADEVLKEKVVYEVDAPKLEQLCRQGEVENDILRAAYHEEELAPAALPGTPKPFVLPDIPGGGQ